MQQQPIPLGAKVFARFVLQQVQPYQYGQVIQAINLRMKEQTVLFKQKLSQPTQLED
jgi:hypothetical protein